MWQASVQLEAELARRGLVTWARRRRRAAEIANTVGEGSYDAVLVDEAQDLDATVIRLLLALCRSPDRFFLTADANQSIYGGSFRWTEVHSDLRFRGRTAVLRRNHRSTREIGEAAQSFLLEGLIDPDGLSESYLMSGPRPAMRHTPSAEDETALVVRFLRGAARELHFGLPACAVLVPTDTAGRLIAERLTRLGVSAAFMPGRELDLERPVTKVLTLKSAKGLEFPVVVVAGFHDGRLRALPHAADPDWVREMREDERRTLFVAFTRAMRALLVALPNDAPDVLSSGFDQALWNVGAVS